MSLFTGARNREQICGEVDALAGQQEDVSGYNQLQETMRISKRDAPIPGPTLMSPLLGLKRTWVLAMRIWGVVGGSPGAA